MRWKLSGNGLRVLGLGVLITIALGGCGASVPEPLERGSSTIGRMMAPMQMKRSMFFVAYPDGKPSDYVRFMFSPIGSAELPPQEGGLEFPEMAGQSAMGPGGPPILPKDVILQPYKPLADSESYQLVLNGDDAKGVVVVTGYLPTHKAGGTREGNPQPVLTREVILKKVVPDEAARLFYRSNVEMGASPAMSPQNFQNGPR